MGRDHRRFPVHGRPDARVLEPPEPDERPQEIAGEAVDRARRRRYARALRRSEAAVGGLGVFEYVLARRAHQPVGAVRAHLVQEDHGPDRARILGTVAGAGLDRVALRVLCREDGGDRLRGHRRRPRIDEVGVIGRPIHQVAEGQVTDRRAVGLEQPFQRYGPVRHRAT